MKPNKPGDAFERAVEELLDAGGWEVERDKKVGTMQVDVFASKRDFGAIRRLAVEAKDWGRRLTKNDFANIYAKYIGLIKNNLIDNVLIVADRTIDSKPKAYVSENPDLRFQTFAELERTLFDVGRYLKYLISQYEEDGLDSYYVPVRLDRDECAEEVIASWLADDRRSPLALLADYGMGKTTLARHLAHSYAVTAYENPEARIPIFIPLGDIATDQNLAGLVGRVLTGDHPAGNYSYPLFRRLNRAGRLFIILDGFDEMKHAMGYDAFEYTVRQLNELAEGRAKVLLLGRPSAFLSDLEATYVLRGKRDISVRLAHRDPNAPVYIERWLAMFHPTQAAAYVERYLLYCEQKAAEMEGRAPDNASARRRAEELRSGDFDELLTRPVHGRMLVELACDRNVILDAVSEFDLYELFVTSLTRREAQKPGRRAISYDGRLRFAEDLAWWSLVTNKVNGFASGEVPDELIQPYRADPADDLDPLRRELLAGCFLESKAYGVQRFPHRSFVEFLVARRLLQQRIRADALQELSRILTDAVRRFIDGSPNPDEVYSIWFDLMDTARGDMGVLLLDGAAEAVRRGKRSGRVAPEDGFWTALAKFLALPLESPTDAEAAIRHAVEVFRVASHGHVRDAAIIMLLLGAKRDAVRADWYTLAIGAMLLAGLDAGTVHNAGTGRWVAPLDDRQSTAGLLFGGTNLYRPSGAGQLFLAVQSKKMLEIIRKRLRPAFDLENLAGELLEATRQAALGSLEPPYFSDEDEEEDRRAYAMYRLGCSRILEPEHYQRVRNLLHRIRNFSIVIPKVEHRRLGGRNEPDRFSSTGRRR